MIFHDHRKSKTHSYELTCCEEKNVILAPSLRLIRSQVLGAGVIDGRSPWAFEPTKAVSLVRDIASAVMQDNPNGMDVDGATNSSWLLVLEARNLVNKFP